MKKKVQQPEFYEIEVNCITCGQKHLIGTTSKEIKVEVCSNCHSFYTGKQGFAIISGQLDKFRKRYNPQNEKVITSEEEKSE